MCEEGFSDPWTIAMDGKSSKEKVLNYGMRWGIESLFSDMKTREFGITKTQLKDPGRDRKVNVCAKV